MRDERSFTLTLEVDPVDERASWAQWEALAVDVGRDLPGRLLATLAHEVQHRVLNEACGPRWRPTRGRPAPFACTRCGAEEDFARKGRRSRPRRLDTAVGVVRLRLCNVACRGCGRVFAPLLVMLGIDAGVRRSDRLSLALTELATQVSYGRAATIAREVGGMPATAPRAHAALADVAGLLGQLGPPPHPRWCCLTAPAPAPAAPASALGCTWPSAWSAATGRPGVAAPGPRGWPPPSTSRGKP